ncbi:Elongation factor P--(R)-beta-lysine ligase [Bremerella volcania]|uniref:Elongation factor P--(R)-beta-lysine ligase n=1 Tax=Bremerella volcania TaxID=2527984 RepID=A0A518C2C0_9BACT|nr:EF-P lysine aminoacylase EpmA [Bremerella volcania]QDU73369.1 Elongation factor P--(R)-beta-lysine ligase [Bremerella volcania]
MANETWRPSASIDNLKRRHEITQAVRAFFLALGFWEVETPLLSRDTVVDTHLDPVPVSLSWDPARPSEGEPYYLQTSPEFAMKRLVAAGAEAIFQITKAFRLAEAGSQHNVEFTLIEWYRVGDDLQAGMRLLSDLAVAILQRGPAEMISYTKLFQTHLSIDPLTATSQQLRAVAEKHHVSVPASFMSDDVDGLLELLLSELIQPKLGFQQPVILYHYPASQAALARLDEADPRVACRFELLVDGMELANGYDELLDAELLVERNRANNAARQTLGKPQLPESSQLIEAMRAGLPACSGCALGLDRLVMAAIGAKSIDEVIPFPTRQA